MSKDHDQIWDEWQSQVNMTPKELEDWLETVESPSVGAKEDGGESTGHKSGRRIVEIKRTNKGDLTHDQWDHMGKVLGYIGRHTAQRPQGDVEETPWRYSLMNWGHDPLK